jgi:hypothetical protein
MFHVDRLLDVWAMSISSVSHIFSRILTIYLLSTHKAKKLRKRCGVA